MSQFTVRVQLHEAKLQDYDALHAAMEARGFSRLITSDQGQTYHLPWAEYSANGNLTAAEVRDIAKVAADITGKRNAILVTQSVARAWAGLALAR